jgi:hypothetical protein
LDLGLTDKRALITGGSRGIGNTIARTLLAEGALVMIAARDEKSLRSVAEELDMNAKARIYWTTFDAQDDRSVEAMVARASEQLGGLDIVVNAAATPASVGGPAGAETPGAKRTSILKTFKSITTKPQVLCNYGVLTTGFDAPRTSAAIIARPTKSLVLYSQMVGRAIHGKTSMTGGREPLSRPSTRHGEARQPLTLTCPCSTSRERPARLPKQKTAP